MVATMTFLPFIVSSSVMTLTALDFLGFLAPVFLYAAFAAWAAAFIGLAGQLVRRARTTFASGEEKT